MGSKIIALALSSLTLLSGCGDDRERNVIVETAPFVTTEVPLGKGQQDAAIRAVRAFANRHRMDFLLAQKTLEPGDFNASANSSTLNLNAMHIESFDDGVSVTAIARASPTSEDQRLFAAFLTDVRASAAPPP